jgi:hypothetical protein
MSALEPTVDLTPREGTLVALRAAIDLGRSCCVASDEADQGDEIAATAWGLSVGLEPGAVVHGVRLFRGRSPVIGWDDEFRLLEALGRACAGRGAYVAAAARILNLRRRTGTDDQRNGGEGVAAFLAGTGRSRAHYDGILRELAAQVGRERVGTRIAERLPQQALIVLGEAHEEDALAVLRRGILDSTAKQIRDLLDGAERTRLRLPHFFTTTKTSVDPDIVASTPEPPWRTRVTFPGRAR